MAQKISVDIVADLVCPWCWLGKRNWDAAVAAVPEVSVETIWRPTSSIRRWPAKAAPIATMKAKFSSADDAGRWKAMREYLEQAAPGAGIDFRFDAIEMRPNTLDAHRLMRWARGQDCADAMAESLFAAFFRDARDIGDRAVLNELAGEAGLDAAITGDLLASDRDEKAVWEEEVFFRKLGVTGVPTYIFNGQFAVSAPRSRPCWPTPSARP